MLKYWAFLLTILLAGTVFFCHEMFAAGDGSLSVLDVFAEEQRVNEKVMSYREFQQVLHWTLDDLTDGAIGLDEATTRVHEAAQTSYPNHLRAIAISNPGKTVRESVARNLLGHLRDRPAIEEHLPGLEMELAEMVGARDRNAVALTSPE